MIDSNLASICPGCGAPNRCAIAAGRDAASCWCQRTPLLAPPGDQRARCYCDACLQALAGMLSTHGATLADEG